MELFHIIEDAQAIALKGGIYKQTKVYRRGEDIYIAQGSGYLKCFASGDTSAPKGRWINLYSDFITLAPGKAPKFNKEAWEVELRVREKAEIEAAVKGYVNPVINRKRGKNGNTVHKPRSAKKNTRAA